MGDGSLKKIMGYCPETDDSVPVRVNSDGEVVLALSENAVDKRDFNAKGDILVGSGDDSYGTLPVGANDKVLTADSGEALGAKWATPTAGMQYSDTRSKAITATRDLTAASGDVAYTGVGFTPAAIIAFATVPTMYNESQGICDSAKTVMSIIYNQAGISSANTTALCQIITSGGNQSAIVKSFDADGFTLTWTKTSLPTLTATLIFLCFR